MVSGIYTCKYIGKDKLMGFEKNKKYAIKIDKQENMCYTITELQDDLYIELSSEASIKRYFSDLKLEE